MKIRLPPYQVRISNKGPACSSPTHPGYHRRNHWNELLQAGESKTQMFVTDLDACPVFDGNETRGEAIK